MSEAIKHECGIALVRLKKPLQFYKDRYGTAFFGLNKMYLLMEKQHNRGQDGAGLASIKLNAKPGQRYISRMRSNKTQPIQHVFKKINVRLNGVFEKNPDKLYSTNSLEEYYWQGKLYGIHSRGRLRKKDFTNSSLDSKIKKLKKIIL